MIRFGEDVCRNLDSGAAPRIAGDQWNWRVCLGHNQRMQYTPIPRASASMAMRRIAPLAALRKLGASLKYSGRQWKTFTEFDLADQSLYSSRLARRFNSGNCCL
jgi:hypothetical protein